MENILITGSTSSIGKETIKALSAKYTNSNFGLVGRTEKKILNTVKDIGLKDNFIPIVADLTKLEDIQSVRDNFINEFKNISILVNAAGYWHSDQGAIVDLSLQEISSLDIQNCLNIELQLPIQLIKSLIADFKNSKIRKIVHVSSVFDSCGQGMLPFYASNKGVQAFIKGISEELRRDLIQVNCVCPWITNTEAVKKHYSDGFGSGVDPSEIAKVISYLCSTECDNITGQNIEVRRKDDFDSITGLF